MSYNIDSIEYVEGTGPLSMHHSVRLDLATALADRLPEGCFLTNDNCVGARHSSGMEAIIHPSWTDECSGSAFDHLKEALTRTLGRADLVICWEGGDRYSGLRVCNGVVTERVVVMSLGEVRS